MSWIKTINVSLEQGTITSSGNSDSDYRLRSPNYITSTSLSVKVSASANTGKAVMVDLLGYTSVSSSSNVFDLYWYDSPKTFDLSSYSNVRCLRVCLKYSDGSAIVPEDITSCTLELEYHWIDNNGSPTNPDFPQNIPEKPFVEPYPNNLWRISNGQIYHELYPEPQLLGAFANCHNLNTVVIPESVKSIGEYAFRNTQLTSVTIARDCTYYSTSFPDGCIINFYD